MIATCPMGQIEMEELVFLGVAGRGCVTERSQGRISIKNV